MGSNLPEGPLQNGRTYIYVRIWSGFPKSMDIAAFADVDNDEIKGVLGSVAAMWMREAPVALVFPEEQARAKKVAAPPTEVLEALTPQTIEEIGMAWFAALMYKRPIAAPLWVLLHVEATLEHALALVETLHADTNLGCPFEFKLLGRHELAREQAVRLDRDLLEWESRNRPFELIAKPFHWKHHPLRSLRDSALKFSPIVAKDLAAESVRSATISAGLATVQQPSDSLGVASEGSRGSRTALRGRGAPLESQGEPPIETQAFATPGSDEQRFANPQPSANSRPDPLSADGAPDQRQHTATVLPVDPNSLQAREIAFLRRLVDFASRNSEALQSSAQIAEALCRQGIQVSAETIRRTVVPLFAPLLDRNPRGYRILPSQLALAQDILRIASAR